MWVVRNSLFIEVTFERIPEGREGANHEATKA